MNAHDPETSEQRYLDVIHRKTARLFEAGAEVAAVLSQGPADVQAALASYGGISARPTNSWMMSSTTARTHRRGARISGTICEGKPTYPSFTR